MKMQLTIKESEKESLLSSLKIANLAFQEKYPGDRPDRQPVHTVYGGANLFKSDTCPRMGETALKNLRTYAPNFAEFARTLGLEGQESLPHTDAETQSLDQKLQLLPEDQRRKEKAW